MNTELIVPVLFRWLHILAAIVAVGGTFFLRFVLLPSAQDALSAEQHAALRAGLIRRWKIVVMVCITALLVSGVYNFVFTALPKGRVHPAYHPLFGVKFLAALGVFFIASALTGRAAAFAKMRQNSRYWLTASAFLALLVVLISGVLGKLK